MSSRTSDGKNGLTAHSHSLLIEPGSTIKFNDRLEILEHVHELGSGSCSSTHLARDKQTNHIYAVKLSDRSSSCYGHEVGKPHCDLRFNEEVNILTYIHSQLGQALNNVTTSTLSTAANPETSVNAQLARNGIIALRGYEQDKYQNLMVLEYCDRDLEKELEYREKLPESEVRKMVKQLASALGFLHNIGVAHRDIKPSNILLKSKRSGAEKKNTFKLSDFDLAYCDYRKNVKPRKQSSTANTHKSESTISSKLEMCDIVGSLEYMCPEIAWHLLEGFRCQDNELEMNDVSYSEKADIWSFGVMLYQVLTGERPFTNNESHCGPDCEYWAYGENCKYCEEAVLESICYVDVEYPQRLWRNISIEARDLVSRCLVRDAGSRISALEILEHPFLTRKRKVMSQPFAIRYRKSMSLPSMGGATSEKYDNSLNMFDDFFKTIGDKLSQ